MKSIVTILVTVIILVTAQSCRKERMGNCSGCNQQQIDQGCTTTNDMLTVNQTVNVYVNNVLVGTAIQTTSYQMTIRRCPGELPDTTYGQPNVWTGPTTYFNTGGGGNNNSVTYVTGFTRPYPNSLTIGQTYWGLTTAPGTTTGEVALNPIGIKITGVSPATGKYTYEIGTTTYYSQTGKYVYLHSNADGGGPLKGDLFAALNNEGYPFVIVII